MNVQTHVYKHFGKCLWIDNGVWELGVTLEFGPRIIYFALADGENIFYEQPQDADYLCTPEGWRVFGGTRLWLAPESEHQLYNPDLAPVSYEWNENAVVVAQAEDAVLGAAKQITIAETDDSNSVLVGYQIQNTGERPLVGAPWAVSAMRAGGVLTVPFHVERGELTARPGRFLSLWNTTSLADVRLNFTNDTMIIAQKPVDAYFKLGLFCATGEAQYRIGERVFAKTFPVLPGSVYPDGGVNLAVYCCAHMLEFETLAPLEEIFPGGIAEHTERWTIL